MVLPFLFLVMMTWIGNSGISVFAAKEAQAQASTAEGLQKGASLRVLWKITGYKVGPNAVWGEEEARGMLFKTLDMDHDAITFDGQTCSGILFRKETVKTREYLDRVYHVTPRELSIESDVIEVVKTNCDLPGFAEFMRLPDRRIVIHVKGVFFYFEAAVNY